MVMAPFLQKLFLFAVLLPLVLARPGFKAY